MPERIHVQSTTPTEFIFFSHRAWQRYRIEPAYPMTSRDSCGAQENEKIKAMYCQG